MFYIDGYNPKGQKDGENHPPLELYEMKFAFIWHKFLWINLGKEFGIQSKSNPFFSSQHNLDKCKKQITLVAIFGSRRERSYLKNA